MMCRLEAGECEPLFIPMFFFPVLFGLDPWLWHAIYYSRNDVDCAL